MPKRANWLLVVGLFVFRDTVGGLWFQSLRTWTPQTLFVTGGVFSKLGPQPLRVKQQLFCLKN